MTIITIDLPTPLVWENDCVVEILSLQPLLPFVNLHSWKPGQGMDHWGWIHGAQVPVGPLQA